MNKKAEITSVSALLKLNLSIPYYQRPYKWTSKHIVELLIDIDNAITKTNEEQEYKYRIGSVILHYSENNEYNIVDGRQRIVSLILLNRLLDESFQCSLLIKKFDHKVSQENIHNNYYFIKDWFSLKSYDKDKFLQALDKTLEFVIIVTNELPEAFQMFDSPNTRGKRLNPHDLLKAYHLREMKNDYEMQRVVTKYEAVEPTKIKNLFELYLFPIQLWVRYIKSHAFSIADIGRYKGIDENSPYTYAKMASHAIPYFQITEQFISGKYFFDMVDHYLNLLNDLHNAIDNREEFSEIKMLLNKPKSSTGFKFAKELFFCAILCFYDRFGCIDEGSVKKLFSWAFMLRVDMEMLGFPSINKYAIGEGGDSNRINVFKEIVYARQHAEIANIRIEIKESKRGEMKNERKMLYESLKKLNNMEA